MTLWTLCCTIRFMNRVVLVNRYTIVFPNMVYVIHINYDIRNIGAEASLVLLGWRRSCKQQDWTQPGSSQWRKRKRRRRKRRRTFQKQGHSLKYGTFHFLSHIFLWFGPLAALCKFPISSQTIKYRYKLKSNQKKKFPKIASIDPPNVCTKFIVRYKKFK